MEAPSPGLGIIPPDEDTESRPPKRSRPDVARRREFNQEHEFTVIKTCLMAFCTTESGSAHLPWCEVLLDMNKATAETYILANAHVIRLCRKHLPIPALDPAFFRRCLVGSRPWPKGPVRRYKSRSPLNILLNLRIRGCEIHGKYAQGETVAGEGSGCERHDSEHADEQDVSSGSHEGLRYVRPPPTRYASRFMNLRFKRHIFKQKKMHAICRELTAAAGRNTVIGFGDWSNYDPNGTIKRSPAGPIQQLKAQPKRYCRVVSIDEFRTSQIHSDPACQNMLTNQVSLRLCKGGIVRNLPIHSVLHCKTSGCGVTVNRDVNASENMLALLRAQLQGLPRSRVFCR